MPSERWTKSRQRQLENLLSFAPPKQELSWTEIDHLGDERLWWHMRDIDRAGLAILLSRALAALPVGQLESVCDGYLFAGDIGEPSNHTEPGVHEAAERFCSFAKAGHYYEHIDYDGARQSDRTHDFCARCQCLFERCIAAADSAEPAQAVSAFEALMDLLRLLDEQPDEIVHFTDEPGAWQVGIDWGRALRAYFRCLARTAARDGYDQATVHAIDDFSHEHREELVAAAANTWASLNEASDVRDWDHENDSARHRGAEYSAHQHARGESVRHSGNTRDFVYRVGYRRPCDIELSGNSG